MFRDGSLNVPKQQQNLQKLLSLYHPLKGRLYEEFSAVQEAEDELDVIELQIDALNAAKAMDIDQIEAIMRVEVGSKVSQMSSKELKRDLLLFAKNNPKLFVELANDENVQLRNVAIVACENGIILLSQDQRTFTWGSNGRKLMNIPFDENPYSAMAAWFKTDEGVEVYKSIEKKLL
jgi:wyosine [tRNA(Phe)-imidazoG37] synthetase (radical SAM superfamily)